MPTLDAELVELIYRRQRVALRQCRECKAMISTDAAKCPQCGASNPTPQRAIISLISVVASVAFIVWIYKSCDNLFKSTPSTHSTRTGIEQAESKSAGQSVVSDLQGPPEGYNGAGVVLDGLKLYVYRMAIYDSYTYKMCQDFTGPGYSFMVLGLDASSATEKFTWHCWTDRIVVALRSGSESKTIDLSDMDGFYGWSLNENFACTKTVYPGKTEFHYLAFYPSFSWKDVVKVTFFTGAFGHKENQAFWIKIGS